MATLLSLETTWPLLWLRGYAEDHQGTNLVTWVGRGPSECCDGYMGKMRTTRMLWWLHVVDEDHQCAEMTTGVC